MKPMRTATPVLHDVQTMRWTPCARHYKAKVIQAAHGHEDQVRTFALDWLELLARVTRSF